MSTEAKVTQAKEAPKTFKYVAKFKRLDGSEDRVTVQYYYRDRMQAAKLQDELRAFAKDKNESQSADPSMVELITAANEVFAETLLKMIHEWDRKEPLNVDSLIDLCNTEPALTDSLREDYWTAVLSGRRGN